MNSNPDSIFSNDSTDSTTGKIDRDSTSAHTSIFDDLDDDMAFNDEDMALDDMGLDDDNSEALFLGFDSVHRHEMLNGSSNSGIGADTIGSLQKSTQCTLTNNLLGANLGNYSDKKINILGYTEPYLIPCAKPDDPPESLYKHWTVDQNFWDDLNTTENFAAIMTDNANFKAKTARAREQFRSEMEENFGFSDEYRKDDITVEEFKNLVQQSNLSDLELEELTDILKTIQSLLLQFDFKADARVFYSVAGMYIKLTATTYSQRTHNDYRKILNTIKDSVFKGLVFLNCVNGRIIKGDSIYNNKNAYLKGVIGKVHAKIRDDMINDVAKKYSENLDYDLAKEVKKNMDLENMLGKEIDYNKNLIKGFPFTTDDDEINRIKKSNTLITSTKREVKNKMHITFDYMMIIAKYFESRRDFVNLVKVNKLYKDILGYFYFNPIDDCAIDDFFPKVKTLHFYNGDVDYNTINRAIDNTNKFKYVIWKDMTGNQAYSMYKKYDVKKDSNQGIDIFSDSVKHADVINTFNTNRETSFPPVMSKDIEIRGNVYGDTSSFFVDHDEYGLDFASFLPGTTVVSCCKYNLINNAILQFPNTVTSITAKSFQDNGKIVRVVFPESIRSIGELAFNNCSHLTSIGMQPNTFSVIPSYCFNSVSITNLDIPEGVTALGDHSFASCTNLTSITLPNTLVSIGNGAFARCRIGSIKIPSSVCTICESAFAFCTNLTDFTCEDNISSTMTIEKDVFYKCSTQLDIRFNFRGVVVDIRALNTVNGNVTVKVNVKQCRYIDKEETLCYAYVQTANGPVNFTDPSAVELLNEPTGRDIINTVTIEEFAFGESGITQL